MLPQQQHEGAPLWPWLVGGGVLAALAGLWATTRRRRVAEPLFDQELAAEETPVEQPAAEALAPAPVPAEPVSAAEPATQAQLTVDLHPSRAGLNLISATVVCEVTLANLGDAPAADIRAEVALLSAHAGQEADLEAFYAQAPGRPATPPFTLQPGEQRRFRTVAALPHDAIRAMTAGGRPMFVPLVALSVRFRDGAATRQVAQAFAVGVERVDSAKLAPFWLDVPARQYDSIAARPHGVVREAG